MKKNKCNVVMLATDKKINIGNFTIAQYDKLEKPNFLICGIKKNESQGIIEKPQHLYITSSDEIKEDENYYSKVLNKVCKNQFENKIERTDNRYKKIIAATDSELHKDGVAKIGLPFIEKYITEHNKSTPITTVLIEYDNRCCGRCDGIHDLCLADQQCKSHKILGCEICFGSRFDVPKLRSDGTIIIHKIQEVFTKKDMERAYKAGEHRGLFIDEPEETIFRTFKEWFEQNY